MHIVVGVKRGVVNRCKFYNKKLDASLHGAFSVVRFLGIIVKKTIYNSKKYVYNEVVLFYNCR